MDVRNTTEAFLKALKNTYFSNSAKVTTEYLRGECRLLSFLSIEPKRRYKSGELAKHLGITTARIASTLNTLEKKGFIKRETSPEDKRRVYVAITEEGFEYIERKRENVCVFFDGIFSELEKSECDEFIRLIEKIADIGENNSK